jgi:hypothetical protein
VRASRRGKWEEHIKEDVLGDQEVVGGNIKALIPFVIRGVAGKDTPIGARVGGPGGWDSKCTRGLESVRRWEW